MATGSPAWGSMNNPERLHDFAADSVIANPFSVARHVMRHFSGAACGAFLTLCCVGAGSAGAQTADIKTIVSLGGPPVVLNQNSQLNMAGGVIICGRPHPAGTHKATRKPDR